MKRINILKQFYFKNIYSFENETVIDFKKNRTSGEYLNSLYLLGKNNSGKTNVLKTIRDFRNQIIRDIELKSNDDIFSVFRHNENINPNIEAEIILFDGENDYIYGFVANKNFKVFVKEWLYLKPKLTNRESKIFEISRSFKNKEKLFENSAINKEKIEQHLKQIETKFELGKSAKIGKKLEKESQKFLEENKDKLLLVYLKNIGVEIPRKIFGMIKKISFIEMNEKNGDLTYRIFDFLLEDRNKERVASIIRDFDLSIEDLEVTKFKLDDVEKLDNLFQLLVDVKDKKNKENLDKIESIIDTLPEKTLPHFSFVSDSKERSYRFDVIFKDGKKSRFFDQSSGTRKMIILVSQLLMAKDEGKILLIDELESGLHFLAFEALVDKFISKIKNTSIILTVHNYNILDDENISKEQVIFVDRDAETLSSKLTYLSQFKTRSDVSLGKKYINGLLSGVPIIE